jgi:hypothetical protein
VSGKYISMTDAARILDQSKAALAGLEDKLYLAILERITPDMTQAEISAITEAEVASMMKQLDQMEAETYAQLDAAAVDGPDDAGEGAS